ncbi:hypothetical protein F6V25_09730 [Oryzomonas japonica]|uniref:Uncharacterized protein n=1 Tax=Oryzomonas japonica TaxID=2603858 RepID=A0A7J4ZR65_9BACT|nr:hypothetical protein F6V25_09730 [Oryzomonas japonica]
MPLVELDGFGADLGGGAEQHEAAALPAELFFEVHQQDVGGKPGEMGLDKDHGRFPGDQLLAPFFKAGCCTQRDALVVREPVEDLPEARYIGYQQQVGHVGFLQ